MTTTPETAAWVTHAWSLEQRSLTEQRQTFDQSAKQTPAIDRPRTIAHLASTSLIAAGHVERHLAEAKAARTAQGTAFNIDHATTHAAEIAEHLRKLIAHLRIDYPAVGKELDKLEAAISTGGEKQVP